jgi:hypothetical protein
VAVEAHVKPNLLEFGVDSSRDIEMIGEYNGARSIDGKFMKFHHPMKSMHHPPSNRCKFCTTKKQTTTIMMMITHLIH